MVGRLHSFGKVTFRGRAVEFRRLHHVMIESPLNHPCVLVTSSSILLGIDVANAGDNFDRGSNSTILEQGLSFYPCNDHVLRNDIVHHNTEKTYETYWDPLFHEITEHFLQVTWRPSKVSYNLYFWHPVPYPCASELSARIVPWLPE